MNQPFSRYKRAVIALSGGGDSAAVLLLAVKHMGAENILAATCVNDHIFSYEIETAEEICRKLNVKHYKFKAEMPPEFYENNPERCYHCKNAIMSHIKSLEGYDVVFDGTSADDKSEGRPGMRALNELSIVSPLKEMGLCKTDARYIIRELGMDFHDESCKATRLSGKIDKRMNNIELVEDRLREDYAGIRYRIDDKRVEFKTPLKSKIGDFEKIKSTIQAYGYQKPDLAQDES